MSRRTDQSTAPKLDRYGIPIASTPTDRLAPVKKAGATVSLLLVAMWLQEILDTLLPVLRLDSFGIQPKDLGSFWHIFTAPFLHGGFAHLIANSLPFLVLAFFTAVRSMWRFVQVTLSIIVVGGSLVWLFGGWNTIHLGASQLIFGYLAYLLGVGWWERTPAAVGIALGAFFMYGGILWGVLPSDPRVSWEAHLFGFVGGILAAMWLHKKRPVEQSGGY